MTLRTVAGARTRSGPGDRGREDRAGWLGWGRRLTACVAAAVLLVAAAGPASAHNRLLETEPAEDARLDDGPSAITLRFDQAVNEGFGAVVVTGPEGGEWQNGQLRESGDTATQKLLPLGPAGEYEVTWRVVSADGHPISGTFGFTLTTAGDGTPRPESTSDDASGASGGGWLPLALGLVSGALVLVGLVVAGLAIRSRASGRRSPPTR